MATDQTAFDVTLAATVQQLAGVTDDIATQTTKINTTVQAIIDKIASGAAPADLTAEAATLAAMQQNLTTAKASLDAIAGQLPTTPTPPVTPPAPVVVPPVTP